MPYKDPEKRRDAQRERTERHRAKRHAERFGPDAGDMRGRHGNQARAERNGRFNMDERRLTSHGYVVVRVAVDHPHAWGPKRLRSYRYAYEHVVVAMARLGRQLTDGEMVHHRNHDKADNRPSNLLIMSRSEHARLHGEERGRDRLGRFPPKSAT